MSKFSDFIRNASDKEKDEVMHRVMDKAWKDQERLLDNEE